MKIDTLIRYLKFDPELLRKLNDLPQGAENNNNLADSKGKNPEVLQKSLSDILPLTGKLEQSLQKQIIKTWLEMKLPLNKTHIKKLVQYLQNNNYNQQNNNLNQSASNTGNTHINNIKPEILIKSFAFLLKNNLPVKPQLLSGTAANLDAGFTEVNHSHNTSVDLNNTDPDSRTNSDNIGNNTTNNTDLNNSNISTKINNNLPGELETELKNSLVLRLNSSTSQIQEQLQQYSHQIQEAIQLMQNSNQQENSSLLNHLLGQQALNLQETLPENNQLLLALEIPVMLTEDSKTIPLFLQIQQKEEQKNSNGNNTETQTDGESNNFKINFIIKLNKLGIIRADIKIEDNKILSRFKTSADSTQKLIQQEFPLLKEKFEKIGYTAADPVLAQLKKTEVNNSKNGRPFPESIVPINKRPEGTDELIHIDFKV